MRVALPISLLCLAACAGPAEPQGAVLHTRALAERLALQYTGRWPAESLYLDWMQTVFAFGLLRLHRATGENAWLDYDRDWMLDALPRFEGEDPQTFVSSDSLSPSIIAAGVMASQAEAGVEPSGLEPITGAADAYLEIVPTTDEGAWEHWSEDAPFGVVDQVWIDSQFMLGMYLLEAHRRTADPALLDRFVEQYLLFSELCRSAEWNLYHHAYDDPSDSHVPEDPVFWARGNSWVLISAAEYLDRVGLDQAEPQVLDLFRDHARATLELQAEDGLWRTVMNDPHEDPANYTETSAAALIGYAFARGLHSGALEGEAWQGSVVAAVSGVESRVVEDGEELVVEGTSFGTNPGEYEDYVDVPQVDDLVLGVGAVIMLLAEADGLPADGEDL